MSSARRPPDLRLVTKGDQVSDLVKQIAVARSEVDALGHEINRLRRVLADHRDRKG